MKKIIFAIILVISLFAITGLALAKNASNGGSLGEIWTAINDLQSQISTLKSNEPTSSQKAIVTNDFEKTAKETVARNKHVPHSEHYVMAGLMIQ